MKAIRVREFGGPEVLRVEDVPELKPAASEVVVRIHAAGVNPVETYIRAGVYARKPALPYTPGTDGAGTVEVAGKNATRFAPGARVYVAGSLSGTYAEQALCDESSVFPLSQHVSFAQGAALGVPYGTAYRALFHRGGARAGEAVLVHGASGGAGIAVTQLARAAGLHVVGTAGTDKGRALVKAEGAHEALDHKTPDHFDKALSVTGGRGYDVIIEMLANVNLARDLTILAHGGRVVVVGNRGNIEINPRELMMRDGAILGMTLWNVPAPDLFSIHSALAAGLENKTLRPVVSQEIPLAEASRAHVAIMESSANGKIVLVP
ncbi:MAG TPA: NADPH:quinone reductase [Candidatus Acidoferrales bacterium]|nr:NADPH:quinone reductase [Candidatus Acidoferrales bacterium]